MFVKAGRPGWEALVPGYNLYIMNKLVEKKNIRVILLLVPFVNIFAFYYIVLDFVKAFGKFEFWQSAATVLAPFAYLPYLGFNKEDSFVSATGMPEGQKPPKKTVLREWTDAAIFAIVAATLIRTFVFEAYKIPTSSMENTLLVGDFLFVSKFHYGARVPNTPLAIPFAHNRFLGGKSYSELIKWKYKRLPKLEEIERNDIVVFNFPAGDTVILGMEERVFANEVKKEVVRSGRKYDQVSKFIRSRMNVLDRPVDKKDNYIKRCIGIPGDVIEVKQGELYVNDELNFKPKGLQHSYILMTEKGTDLKDKVKKDLNIRPDNINDPKDTGLPHYVYHVNDETKQKISELPKTSLTSRVEEGSTINSVIPQYFPQAPKLFGWNLDNFGPLMIPARGTKIEFNKENFALYKRAITHYEGNTLKFKDGKYILNGQEATEYTFKMDYYFMMGDNRHNSLDSRAWGFVPEDHVVGKAWFIFFSIEKSADFINKIRWRRLFTNIHSMD